ncbi:MAG TPA: MFS transporter, partial [Mycobacterium sp.]|nr:MFS transporter [Mycobacterium sp.]
MTTPSRQRAAIAVVQVLGLTVWFSAGAVAPALSAQLGISTAAAAWLTGSVQLGFAAGAIASAVGNL